MSAKYIIKLLTLGDSNVGKSSIILRFTDDKFEEKKFATIGIDFKSKYLKFGDTTIKVLVWDTAGQEKFQNIAKQYYNGANGVFLVYDITDKKSFERIDFWLKELQQHNKVEEIFIVLVGNKNDCENERVISFEEGSNYAKENGILYFEVSAKTKQGIEQLFNETIKGAVKKVIQKNNEDFDGEENIKFAFLDTKEPVIKKNKCC